MTENNSTSNDPGSFLTINSVIISFIAMTLGVTAAVLVLPHWLPGLAASLAGDSPKAFWYISRASAFVAMGFLWASMMLGVGISNKMARLWPGAPAAFALHEYLSLLGLGFAAFHGLILLGDHYINFNLLQILIPFTTLNYHPFWVGLGQICFYIWILLVLSFYVRNHIGQKLWRLLHFTGFVAYAAAIVHGVSSGTDSSLGWVQGFYWITGGSFLFLLTYRIVNSLVGKVEKILSSPAHQ